jgi:hypothetical protein
MEGYFRKVGENTGTYRPKSKRGKLKNKGNNEEKE